MRKRLGILLGITGIMVTALLTGCKGMEGDKASVGGPSKETFVNDTTVEGVEENILFTFAEHLYKRRNRGPKSD